MPARRSSIPPGLLAIVGVALAAGSAAGLLAGAATAPAFSPGPAYEVFFSPAVVEIGLLVVLGVLIGRVLLWGSSSRLAPGRFVVTGLVAVLVAVALLVVLEHAGGSGGALGSASSPPPSNSTSSPPQNVTGTLPGGGAGGQLHFLGLTIPSWAPYLVLTVVVVAGAVVAVAMLRRARRAGADDGGPDRTAPVERAAAQRDLRAAGVALDTGSDPRSVVIRLYGQLLERVRPVVGEMDGETPEEIRKQHLERLGIRPGAAEQLTRLFEEARYSSHALGPDAGAQARAAIAAALEDLLHAPGAS